MNNFEYRTVSSTAYTKCLTMANTLLDKISNYTQKTISKISPIDIIHFFESNFNILFVFFESELNPTPKYTDIVWNFKYCPLDIKLVNKISGATIPKKDRYVIMLNQTMTKPRIIFTILHEFSHLYFHSINENKQIFTSKFSGKYPGRILPFEDEANVIASLLFCPTPKLEILLTRGYSFDKIKNITGMSPKGLHNRLLNYLHHILGLSNSKALELVLNLRDNDYKTTIQIKQLIFNKNNLPPKNQALMIKISHGTMIDQNTCLSFLKNLSTSELINELEYAHSTKNSILEQLVLNVYYQKQ